MPYKTKAERQREEWMALLEAVTHIRSADNCDENAAREQLIAALADGALGPLRWQRERDDKPPLFGFTSIVTPTDTPPLGRAWEKAKIRWKTGHVRDDWGGYKPGKWRILLISKYRVVRCWPVSSPSGPSDKRDNLDMSSVVSIDAPRERRKRGRTPEVSNKVKDSMRRDLREGKLTEQELDKMTEEAMKAQYGASRDICRNARLTVLSESEFVEKGPDRIIDK
jgi:hypothetical protein